MEGILQLISVDGRDVASIVTVEGRIEQENGLSMPITVVLPRSWVWGNENDPEILIWDGVGSDIEERETTRARLVPK